MSGVTADYYAGRLYGRLEERERILTMLEAESAAWHADGFEPCLENNCFCVAIKMIRGDY